jgi:hypothetical protein
MNQRTEPDEIATGLKWGFYILLLLGIPPVGVAVILIDVTWHWWRKTAPARDERRRERRAKKHELHLRRISERETTQRLTERNRHEEELRRQAANRPPPPSREQLSNEARERYDAALRLLDTARLDEAEMHAARQAAKQRYLRELDRALK